MTAELLVKTLTFVFLAGILEGALQSSPCPFEGKCSCLANGRIRCSRRKLQEVPIFTSSTFEKFEKIDLSQNKIMSVGPNAFLNLPSKIIDVSNNPLVGISPRAFNGLEDILEEIYLHNTSLNVLHWAVFSDLDQLRVLDLSCNELFALSPELLASTKLLEQLDLSDNQLTALPPELFANTGRIKRLDLSNNRIEKLFEGTFSPLKNLQLLHLWQNLLKDLEGIFTDLNSLKVLNISENRLDHITEWTFSNLTDLRSLDVSYNHLTAVPENAFSRSVRMVELSLSHNWIATITTASFEKMDGLTKLNLSHNKITEVVESCAFVYLKALALFNIEENLLECGCRIFWVEDLLANGAQVLGTCAGPKKYEGALLTHVTPPVCDKSRKKC